MYFFLDIGFLWMVVFLLLIMGLLVLHKDQKSQASRSFLYLTVSIALWIIVAFFEDEATSATLRFNFLRADFAFGSFYAYAFLLFCSDVIHFRHSKSRWFRYSLVLIPTILTGFIFLTNVIISGYEITQSDVINPIFGPGEIFYNILISLAPLLGAAVLIWNYRKVDPLEKTRYIYLIIGLILSIGIALITNVFITNYIEYDPLYAFYARLGMYSSIFIVLLPGYAIIKHRLFNIKIFATEILSFVILLFVFVQIFLANDIYQLTLRIGIFIICFLLFVMLVRTMDGEIKRKEELQKISDSLAVANAELHRLDTAKSEFISIASHQLRTPLTAIRGFVSLLLEGAYGSLEPTVADTLNKVYLANARLMGLVENLLNISRIEAGRIQYQFGLAKIEDILAELKDNFILATHSKGLGFRVLLPQTPLPPIRIDGPKIREALSNIIDNSIKYTEKGEVVVTLEQRGERAVISVADTGIGIDPVDLPHIFKKFERGKDSARVNVSSTGLGLYVCKNFIEAHGGSVRVESAGKSRGTVFIVELPFAGPPEPPETPAPATLEKKRKD